MLSNVLPIDQGDERRRNANCDQHGPYVQMVRRIMHRDFVTDCPECSRIRRKNEDTEWRAKQAREQREALERRMGAALIPKRFLRKGFAEYRAEHEGQRVNHDACLRYAERFPENLAAGRCLILCGTHGTGKTHLAIAIAMQVMQDGPYVSMYRTVSSLLQHVRASFDRRSEYTEAQAFEALTSPHLLVIDEIGATRSSEFEVATLFAIINGRYERELPTIVVSNLSITELEAQLGAPCLDRLRENQGRALVFDWESARKGECP